MSNLDQSSDSCSSDFENKDVDILQATSPTSWPVVKAERQSSEGEDELESCGAFNGIYIQSKEEVANTINLEDHGFSDDTNTDNSESESPSSSSSPFLTPNDGVVQYNDAVIVSDEQTESVDTNEVKQFKYKLLEEEQAPAMRDEENKNETRSFRYIMKPDGKFVKMWKCAICEKEFSHQYTLMRHMPTHTNERKYKCQHCGCAFRQMSTLSQHRAIHSSARPYVCEICIKTFNRVSTLISHRKTHLDCKPHACNICGKAFHQKGNLRNHIFTHTNERPYKCIDCHRGFNQRSNLMCHRVKAHRKPLVAAFPCKSSGNVFYNTSNIYDHDVLEQRKGQHATRNVRLLTNLKRTDDLVAKETVGISCLLIDPIENPAMTLARQAAIVPFAIFKPIDGTFSLVRVLPVAEQNKQVLVPATMEQALENYKPFHDKNTDKSKLLKIPTVATFIQRYGSDGDIITEIQPASVVHLQFDNNTNIKEEPMVQPIKEEVHDETCDFSEFRFVREDGSELTPEEVDLIGVDYLLTAVLNIQEEKKSQPCILETQDSDLLQYVTDSNHIQRASTTEQQTEISDNEELSNELSIGDTEAIFVNEKGEQVILDPETQQFVLAQAAEEVCHFKCHRASKKQQTDCKTKMAPSIDDSDYQVAMLVTSDDMLVAYESEEIEGFSQVH